MMLVVNGTPRNDVIHFKRGGHGKVELRMNGRKMGLFNVTSRIVARGQAGNDAILADECLDVPVQFFGGDGRDVLIGSNKNDLLDGGAGDDFLHGRKGNDRLLGGAGCDHLHGGQGDDTLTGGPGRDHLHDEHGRNVFEYDNDDAKPKKPKKAKK
jgi:Ca2+-binding RTX toxin-like protein